MVCGLCIVWPLLHSQRLLCNAYAVLVNSSDSQLSGYRCECRRTWTRQTLLDIVLCKQNTGKIVSKSLLKTINIQREWHIAHVSRCSYITARSPRPSGVSVVWSHRSAWAIPLRSVVSRMSQRYLYPIGTRVGSPAHFRNRRCKRPTLGFLRVCVWVWVDSGLQVTTGFAADMDQNLVRFSLSTDFIFQWLRHFTITTYFIDMTNIKQCHVFIMSLKMYIYLV